MRTAAWPAWPCSLPYLPFSVKRLSRHKNVDHAIRRDSEGEEGIVGLYLEEMRKKVHSIRLSYAEEAVQEPSVKEMCGVCVGPVEKVPIRSFHAQLHGFLSLTLQGQAAARAEFVNARLTSGR